MNVNVKVSRGILVGACYVGAYLIGHSIGYDKGVKKGFAYGETIGQIDTLVNLAARLFKNDLKNGK